MGQGISITFLRQTEFDRKLHDIRKPFLKITDSLKVSYPDDISSEIRDKFLTFLILAESRLKSSHVERIIFDIDRYRPEYLRPDDYGTIPVELKCIRHGRKDISVITIMSSIISD